MKVVRTQRDKDGPYGGITKRWLKCEACGSSHVTYEVTKYEYDLLVRNSGSVSAFIDRLKEWLDGQSID
jgi:transcriptional regulator NrdR family protein